MADFMGCGKAAVVTLEFLCYDNSIAYAVDKAGSFDRYCVL